MNIHTNREVLPQNKELLHQYLQHIDQTCRAIQRQVKRLESLLQDSSLKKPLLQDLLPAKEVLRRLQISSSTLFRLRKKGLLPHYRIGRHVYYDIQELIREKIDRD